MRADDSADPHPEDTNANTGQPERKPEVQSENPLRRIPAPRVGEDEDRTG
jgi:hypothetical protein